MTVQTMNYTTTPNDTAIEIARGWLRENRDGRDNATIFRDLELAGVRPFRLEGRTIDPSTFDDASSARGAEISQRELELALTGFVIRNTKYSPTEFESVQRIVRRNGGRITYTDDTGREVEITSYDQYANAPIGLIPTNGRCNDPRAPEANYVLFASQRGGTQAVVPQGRPFTVLDPICDPTIPLADVESPTFDIEQEEIRLAQALRHGGSRLENMDAGQSAILHLAEPPMDAAAYGTMPRGWRRREDEGVDVNDVIYRGGRDTGETGTQGRVEGRRERYRSTTRTMGRESLLGVEAVVRYTGDGRTDSFEVIESQRNRLKAEGLTIRAERDENDDVVFRMGNGAVISVNRYYNPWHSGWNVDAQTAYTPAEIMRTAGGLRDYTHYAMLMQNLTGIPADRDDEGVGQAGLFERYEDAAPGSAERVALARQILEQHVHLAANPDVWSVQQTYAIMDNFQIGEYVREDLLGDSGMFADLPEAELEAMRTQYGEITYEDPEAVMSYIRGRGASYDPFEEHNRYRASLTYTQEGLQELYEELGNEGEVTEEWAYNFLREDANRLRRYAERVPGTQEYRLAGATYHTVDLDSDFQRIDTGVEDEMISGFVSARDARDREGLAGNLALLNAICDDASVAQAFTGSVRIATRDMGDDNYRWLNFEEDWTLRSSDNVYRMRGVDNYSHELMEAMTAFHADRGDARSARNMLFYTNPRGGVRGGVDDVVRTISLGHFGFDDPNQARAVGEEFQRFAREVRASVNQDLADNGVVDDERNIRALAALNRFAEGARDADEGAIRHAMLTPFTLAQIERNPSYSDGTTPEWATNAYARMQAGMGDGTTPRDVELALRRVEEINMTYINAGDISIGYNQIETDTGLDVEGDTGATRDEVDARIDLFLENRRSGRTTVIAQAATGDASGLDGSAAPTVDGAGAIRIVSAILSNSADKADEILRQAGTHAGLSRYTLHAIVAGTDAASNERRAALLRTLEGMEGLPGPVQTAVEEAVRLREAGRNCNPQIVLAANALFADTDGAATLRAEVLQRLGSDAQAQAIATHLAQNEQFSIGVLRTLSDATETRFIRQTGANAAELSEWRDHNDGGRVIRSGLINPGSAVNPLANIFTNNNQELVTNYEHQSAVIRAMGRYAPEASVLLTAELLAQQPSEALVNRVLGTLRHNESQTDLREILSDYRQAVLAARGQGNEQELLAAAQSELTAAVQGYMNPTGENAQALLAGRLLAVNTMQNQLLTSTALSGGYVQSLLAATNSEESLAGLQALLASAGGNGQEALAGGVMGVQDALAGLEGDRGAIQSTLVGRGVSPYRAVLLAAIIAGGHWHNSFRLVDGDGVPIDQPDKPIIIDEGLPPGWTGQPGGDGTFATITDGRRTFHWDGTAWFAVAAGGALVRLIQRRGGDTSEDREHSAEGGVIVAPVFAAGGIVVGSGRENEYDPEAGVQRLPDERTERDKSGAGVAATN